MIYKRLFYLALLVLALFLVLAAAPVLVRERISIDSPEDSYVFNGSDIIWYSDLHDTETARVEGATGDITTDGDLTVGGTADFSGATVSGITTSTLDSLTVTGAALITDNLTVDGTLAVTGAVTFGALDGTANDVTFRSDTAGDYMLWDQSEEALTIIGTNGQDALNVDDGNVDIDDDLDVNGVTNLDVTNIAEAATLSGAMILPQQTLVVTAGFTITPTATYVVLTSTGGAYTSDTSIPLATTGMITGQLVIIRNGNASDVLTVDGTGGTVECKTDRALGASDIQTLIFNGTAWNCIAAVADNS